MVSSQAMTEVLQQLKASKQFYSPVTSPNPDSQKPKRVKATCLITWLRKGSLHGILPSKSPQLPKDPQHPTLAGDTLQVPTPATERRSPCAPSPGGKGLPNPASCEWALPSWLTARSVDTADGPGSGTHRGCANQRPSRALAADPQPPTGWRWQRNSRAPWEPHLPCG